MIDHFSGFLENDSDFRQATMDEIDDLISVLEQERSRLRAM